MFDLEFEQAQEKVGGSFLFFLCWSQNEQENETKELKRNGQEKSVLNCSCTTQHFQPFHLFSHLRISLFERG